MFRIEMLPAYEGDSLWVEYGNQTAPHRLIIDAGRKDTYRELVERVAAFDRPAELFVMTHIDDDHIYGAVPLFADGRVDKSKFKDTWYNSYTHIDPEIARKPQTDVLGIVNGEIFAALLLEGEYAWNEAFDHGATVVVPEAGELPRIHLAGGMNLTLLSPTWDELKALKLFWETKLEEYDDLDPGDWEAAMALFSERPGVQPDVLGDLIDIEGLLEHDYRSDADEPNGSSIAFLAEYGDLAVLFTGDSHPPVLEQSIARLLSQRGINILTLDAFKVSHHGSKNNTSVKLLQMIDCRRFLFSTSGSRHDHPDQETIARIVNRNLHNPQKTELYFNYRSDFNGVWDEDDLKEDWNYQTFYPPAGRNITIDL